MMNLKYYLRGLGTGIVVTAVIMCVALGGKKESLSNQEIKERAAELGMVEEGTTLAANLPVKEDGQEEEAKQEETEAVKDAVEAEEVSLEPKKEEAVATAEPSEENVQDKVQTEQDKQTPVPTERPAPTATPESENAKDEAKELEESLRETQDEPETDETIAGTDKKNTTEEAKKPDTSGEMISIEIKSGASSYSVCKLLEDAGLIASASSFDTFLCENGYDKRIRSGVFAIPADADPEQIARIINGKE